MTGKHSHAKKHGLGNTTDHSATTLSELNALLTDAVLLSEDAIQALFSGLDWQESFIDFIDPTDELGGGIPESPGDGDRYIATATGNGWTNNYIYEWDAGGAEWVETIPNEGFCSVNETSDVAYIFNGSAWVQLANVINHRYLLGLDGGLPLSNQYYHLSAAEHTALVASAGGIDDASLEHNHNTDYYTKAQTSQAIADHAADDDAHHAKYTDGEAVTAMGAKADGNPLNHDRPVDFAGAGANGLVPDPGAETGKFLKDDGTWADPTDTDDQDATEVDTVVDNFDGLLTGADDTVQKALDTLDDHNHDADYEAAGAVSTHASDTDAHHEVVEVYNAAGTKQVIDQRVVRHSVTYTNGGITVNLVALTDSYVKPVVEVSVELNSMSYDARTHFTPMITSLTHGGTYWSVTIRCNKIYYDATPPGGLVFSECATNDVYIHIIAEGE